MREVKKRSILASGRSRAESDEEQTHRSGLPRGSVGVSDDPFACKTVNIPVKRPCKPEKPHETVNLASGTRNQVCSDTPRFSYRWSKRAVSSGPHCSTGGPSAGCTGLGRYTGGCTRWVIPGPHTHPLRCAPGPASLVLLGSSSQQEPA